MTANAPPSPCRPQRAWLRAFAPCADRIGDRPVGLHQQQARPRSADDRLGADQCFRRREGRRLLGQALRRPSRRTRRSRSTTLPRFAARGTTTRRWPSCSRPRSTSRRPRRSSPPMARRSPPAASSSRRLPSSARRRRRTSRTGSCISAEAAILDQLGQHDEARKLYSQGARPRAERADGAVQSRHVLRADRRDLTEAETRAAHGRRSAQCRQPRPPEPRARRRPVGALRRGGEDRQRRALARPGGGQRRLSQADARPAEQLAEAEGIRRPAQKAGVRRTNDRRLGSILSRELLIAPA